MLLMYVLLQVTPFAKIKLETGVCPLITTFDGFLNHLMIHPHKIELHGLCV